MKYEGLVMFRLIVPLLLLSACSPSEAQIVTAIAQTELAKPTATFTPEPTATQAATQTPTRTPTPTIEPSPTLALPDVIKETYSDIEVFYHDDFENVLAGFSPTGWHADGERVRTTREHSLEINGQNNVAYTDDATISVNEAVVVRFMFVPGAQFTIGIDGLRQGERIPAFQPGFRSVSILYNSGLRAHYVREQNTSATPFEGDLRLRPDTWYMYTLGFGPGKNFIIKIWDPENPTDVLTHTRQVDEMGSENIFIMWVQFGSRLFIDDLTFIKFSQLLE